MEANDDSRPFAALRQSAEEFKASFDDDIAQCLAVLDSRITALLCDQDTVADSFSDAKRLNAHMEFSKAKLDIFLNMKNVMNDMETSWAEQLADLKETFIENVEIFLAGTKLEVNLPDESPRLKKGRKGKSNSPFSPNVSSLYPTALLFNTAKHIPVLNTLLPKPTDEDDDKIESSPSVNNRSSRKFSTSPSQKNSSTPPKGSSPPKKSGSPLKNSSLLKKSPSPRKKDQSAVRRKNSVRFLDEVSMLEDTAVEADDEEQDVPSTPVQVRERRSRSAGFTPAHESKTQKTSATMKKELRDLLEGSGNMENSGSPKRLPLRSIRGTPTNATNLTPGRKSRNLKGREDAEHKPDVVPGVKSPKKGSIKTPSPVKKSPAGSPKTPKSVHFSLGLDNDDDFDVYSPDINVTRSLPRRRTAALPQVQSNVPDVCITPEVVRSKSKRKTIGGDLSDASVDPSPKRLKRGRSSTADSSIAMELGKADVSDFLESDEASRKDNYSPWIPLSEVGAKVPGQPGIYELKVSQAKKPAYIAACESLRQMLTLHKLKHNTGSKHLDKYVERNAVNILFRYEKMASINEAKAEQKSRIKAFIERHKAAPAYN